MEARKRYCHNIRVWPAATAGLIQKPDIMSRSLPVHFSRRFPVLPARLLASSRRVACLSSYLQVLLFIARREPVEEEGGFRYDTTRTSFSTLSRPTREDLQHNRRITCGTTHHAFTGIIEQVK